MKQEKIFTKGDDCFYSGSTDFVGRIEERLCSTAQGESKIQRLPRRGRLWISAD